MGQQILRQPNGKFAIFSFDNIVLCDAEPDEIVEWFAEEAAKSAREMAKRVLKHVSAGEPAKAYHQFALTWGEAIELDREHDGTAWKKFT